MRSHFQAGVNAAIGIGIGIGSAKRPRQGVHDLCALNAPMPRRVPGVGSGMRIVTAAGMV